MDEKIDKICRHINIDKILNSIISLSRFETSFAKYLYSNEIRHNENLKKQFLLNCVEEDERDFIQLLLHTNEDKCALILNETVIDLIDLTRSQLTHSCNCNLIDYDISNDILKQERRSMSSYGGIYKMISSPRGYLILINNYYTFGTYKEMLRFNNIFYQFHFEIIMRKNLTANQIINLLMEVSQRSSLRHHDAMAFMIITHGNDQKQILGFDDQPIDINYLMDMFNNRNCPNLQGKPRLFFFNCCRGTTNDDGVDGAVGGDEVLSPITTRVQALNSTNTSESAPRIPLPTTVDYLVCYSTLDGHLAYADWDTGTIFGRCLADWFVSKGWYKDINSIITRTNGSLISAAKDMPFKQPFEWIQCLSKLVYFNPSIPEHRSLETNKINKN